MTANKHFETQLPTCAAYFQSSSLNSSLQAHLSQIYDIARDDANLRACVKAGKVEQQAFDHLRKTYPLRREWGLRMEVHKHELRPSLSTDL